MRRLLALGLGVVVLSACSGEQGERAQGLLTRAQTAQSRLASASYEARMSVSMDAQRFSLVMSGGGYFKGRRAGDQLFRMRAEGMAGLGALDVNMAVHGRQATMTMGGRTYSTPVPATTKQQLDWSSTMADLTRHVKQVKVLEDRSVNGERGATITGVIDTAGLLKAVGKLDALEQVTGRSAGAAFDEVAKHLGDVHVALFVSERTGLIRSAVIRLGIEAEGRQAAVELTYRLVSVNRKIAGL